MRESRRQKLCVSWRYRPDSCLTDVQPRLLTVPCLAVADADQTPVSWRYRPDSFLTEVQTRLLSHGGTDQTPAWRRYRPDSCLADVQTRLLTVPCLAVAGADQTPVSLRYGSDFCLVEVQTRLLSRGSTDQTPVIMEVLTRLLTVPCLAVADADQTPVSWRYRSDFCLVEVQIRLLSRGGTDQTPA